jgi:hypothetical protein
MQSSVLTQPDVAETTPLERRRPGRFDDVSPELVPLLREDALAKAPPMGPEDDGPPDYAFVSPRDPVAERQVARKIVLIIAALTGLVLLFGQ